MNDGEQIVGGIRINKPARRMQLFPKIKKIYSFFPDCDIAIGGQWLCWQAFSEQIGESESVARALRRWGRGLPLAEHSEHKKRNAPVLRSRIPEGVRLSWKVA